MENALLIIKLKQIKTNINHHCHKCRAVYRDSDIYLLDNPLSAVDARVARKITTDCLNGFLKDKTRILVTHNIHQLDDVAEIILLEQVRVLVMGIYDFFFHTQVFYFAEGVFLFIRIFVFSIGSN